MRLTMFVAAALSFAAPGATQPPGATTALQAALHSALDRGALLYLYDEAAWHGSDDLSARFGHLMPLVGGYVVSGDQANVELTFYDKAGSKALYRAKFADQKLVSSGPPASDLIALTPVEQRLIGARAIAMKAFQGANIKRCNKATPNLALLPPTSPTGAVRAYLMTPRTDMESLPMGGHYAVDVSADGKAGPVRAFTNSCLEMSFAAAGKGKPEALVVSHLLDPIPTEIHVFSALTGKIQVYVMTTTNEKLWAVTGHQIRLVQDRAGPSK